MIRAEVGAALFAERAAETAYQRYAILIQLGAPDQNSDGILQFSDYPGSLCPQSLEKSFD